MAIEIPDNILSRDAYVIEKYLQLYQAIKKRRKAPYSRIKLSYSQLFHLVQTGELLGKAGRHEKRFSLAEIVQNQIECYETNNKQRFPDHILEKYGFRRAEIFDSEYSPELRIVPKLPKRQDKVLDPLEAYYSEISDHLILKKEEEEDLTKRAQQGDKEAEQEIIEKNQKFVAAIARKFRWSDMDLLDLIQAGNLGLYKAIKKFDPSYRFSTYAMWWIRQGIWREIKSQKTNVRIPEHTYDCMRALKRIQLRYYSSKNRPPELDEICSETGWSEEKAIKIVKASVYVFGSSKQRDLKSLDKIAEEDKLEKRLLLIRMRELFPYLSKEKQRLLIRRYGLDGNPTETLEEVGKRYGITRERVRQIEEEVLDFFRFYMGLPTKRVDYVNCHKHLKKEIRDMQRRNRKRRKKKMSK